MTSSPTPSIPLPYSHTYTQALGLSLFHHTWFSNTILLHLKKNPTKCNFLSLSLSLSLSLFLSLSFSLSLSVTLSLSFPHSSLDSIYSILALLHFIYFWAGIGFPRSIHAFVNVMLCYRICFIGYLGTGLKFINIQFKSLKIFCCSTNNRRIPNCYLGGYGRSSFLLKRNPA